CTVFRLTASLIVFALLGSLLPLVPCSTAGAAAAIEENREALSDTPDCCKGGMCPSHQQKKPAARTADDKKCVCGVSAPVSANPTTVVQLPAILTRDRTSIELIESVAADSSLLHPTLHPDFSIDPPPPRS